MSFSEHGYEIRERFISLEQVKLIKTEIECYDFSKVQGGIRHAEKYFPCVQELIHSKPLIELASELLNGPVKLIKSTLFNKTKARNWLVSWHQDKSLSVNERPETSNWKNWTLKEGVWYAHPPRSVLEKVICFRLPLDNTNLANGCLQVLPGSHHQGFWTHEAIASIDKSKALACELEAGSLLIMQPLLLHKSGKSINGHSRRVLHIEYML